jgi:hypothetical protein
LREYRCGSTDIRFAAGLLPALAGDGHQFSGGDLDDGPAQPGMAGRLTRAAQRSKRARVDDDTVIWPGMM